MRGKQGYIALLDVLGFEQLVSRESYLQELDRYTETIEQLSDSPGLEYVLFSDTIVISTEDESELSLLNLVRSCSRVFGRLLTEQIPLRGAVARGSFIRVKKDAGVFLAGRAVVEAYRFEKKQDWVGIMLTPSVLAAVSNLETLCQLPTTHLPETELNSVKARVDWMRYVQPCPSVPFHPADPLLGSDYDGFAIVPSNSAICDPSEMIAEIRRMQMHWAD